MSVFTQAEWPHGLRCMDCNRHFEEGMLIARWPVAVDGGMIVTEIVCVLCAIAGALFGRRKNGA